MSTTYELVAERRSTVGKGAGRRARRKGMVPGVLYGPGRQSVAVEVAAKEISRLMAAGGVGSHLVNLHLKGDGAALETKTALIKSVQEDAITREPVHIDLQMVAMDREIHATVPVVLVGENERENDGGIVTQMVREISISCLPGDLPDRIEVDISKMSVGDAVHVENLTVPPGVKVLAPPEEVVVSIFEPRVEAAAPEAAEAEAPGDAEDKE